MEARRRGRGFGSCIGWALAATLALPAAPAAAQAQAQQARCAKDALDDWYCAADERGVAVRDNLGTVLCSPGRCVEVEDEWQCSALAGGRAALGPDGPVCEGGCRSPRAVDCERGRGEPSS
jgi:hypothetical protein